MYKGNADPDIAFFVIFCDHPSRRCFFPVGKHRTDAAPGTTPMT
jgi:hypothetical protein